MTYLFRVQWWVILCALIVAGCSAKETGNPKASRSADVVATTTVLATIAGNEKPQSIAPPTGLGIHPSPANSFQFIFSERGGGVAYIVEKDGTSHVVHNGSAGKPYKTVGTVALSPDGKRIAYGALVDGKWRMVIDGKEGLPFNTVRLPRFSPDSTHLAYQGMAGDRWYLVVDGRQNKGTEKRYLTHEFSGDSSRIAYIDDVDASNRGRLVISDVKFSKETVVGSGVSFMVVDDARLRIAAISTVDNKQKVISSGFDKPAPVTTGKVHDAVQTLAFGRDGASLAYMAVQTGKPVLVLGERESALPDGVMPGLTAVHPDNKTVGMLLQSSNGMFLEQLSPRGESRESVYQAAEGLVYNRDGRFHAYAAQKGQSWFVVVNGKEGPAFDRVVSPKFSPDDKFLVYRARQSGKRFVVVADITGKTIRKHPEYEQVFDVQFTADGKSVAYGVKDGNQLIWKVEKLGNS